MIWRACLVAFATAGPALAEGDVAMGEEIFVTCAGCHQVGPGAVHRLGPHLNDLFTREIGSVGDFHFSPTLREMAGAWTAEALDAYLADPPGYAPGTFMIIEGIADPSERAHLIAYISATGAGAAAGGTDPEVAAILAIAPDEAYGAYLSSECTACHSGGSDIPAIEGLSPAALVAGLLDYRNRDREHQVMNMVAARLGDEEIAALAAYFATAE